MHWPPTFTTFLLHSSYLDAVSFRCALLPVCDTTRAGVVDSFRDAASNGNLARGRSASI